jgi:hypothetical protein
MKITRWQVEQHAIEGIVSAYWEQFYLSSDCICMLCGGCGEVETIATNRDGLLMEYKNYCICPNGQVLREGTACSTM